MKAYSTIKGLPPNCAIIFHHTTLYMTLENIYNPSLESLNKHLHYMFQNSSVKNVDIICHDWGTLDHNHIPCKRYEMLPNQRPMAMIYHAKSLAHWYFFPNTPNLGYWQKELFWDSSLDYSHKIVSGSTFQWSQWNEAITACPPEPRHIEKSLPQYVSWKFINKFSQMKIIKIFKIKGIHKLNTKIEKEIINYTRSQQHNLNLWISTFIYLIKNTGNEKRI